MSFQTTPPAFARALAERDYKDATPVQSAVLQEEAEGRDLLVSAQTGSGKTIAYGLAIADTLLDGAQTMGPAGLPTRQEGSRALGRSRVDPSGA